MRHLWAHCRSGGKCSHKRPVIILLVHEAQQLLGFFRYNGHPLAHFSSYEAIACLRVARDVRWQIGRVGKGKENQSTGNTVKH